MKDFGGNVIVSNIGGIAACYPTQLERCWRAIRAGARALVSGQSLTGRLDAGENGVTWFELPPLGPFEAIAIET